jgi:hypothetical protein
MNQLYYCRIAKPKSGLCNQLFALVTGIILAYQKKAKIVILCLFLNDYLSNNLTPISHIIDLKRLDDFIFSNYGINILDKNYIKLTIHKVIYGVNNNFGDITDIIIDRFYANNTLLIDTNVNLNLLGVGDPLFGQQKYVEITYSLNDITLTDKYEEKYGFLKTPICFNLTNRNFQYDMGWVNKYNKPMFDNILKNIVFLKKWNVPEIEKTKISNYNKINIIHLRLEYDAIQHWSKMNNVSELQFQLYIENKYINIIQKYINKNDITVLLSYYTNNRVINFLKENGYNYHISSKIEKLGREINAIKDISIINMCNNIFIGNFNLKRLTGSSLSYYLINKLSPNIKCITLDLDRITQPVYEFITPVVYNKL